MIHTTADTFVLPAALPLEEGGLLLHAKVAFEAYGRPSTDNAVVLLHDLHHSHRALGATETSPYQPSGWARELVGEGKVVSPRNTYVVSVNLVGSPFGSTSPATIDDETGQPLGPIFPPLTVLDMARAVAGLLRGLGIKRVRLVLGVGLGGMVALRLASLFRDLIAAVAVIGTARSLPDVAREQLALTPQLLLSDPAYQGGHYAPGPGPRSTMKSLRMDFLKRAVVPASASDAPAFEQALDAEADAFSRVFDANCYALLAGAYGRADLSDHLERISARVLLVAAGSDALVTPQRVRDTYHLLTAGGVRANVYELPDGTVSGALSPRLRGALVEFLSGS